jgi:hypothetical protein
MHTNPGPPLITPGVPGYHFTIEGVDDPGVGATVVENSIPLFVGARGPEYALTVGK